MLLSTSLLVLIVELVTGIQHDINGYILYCPCMGRFGNQADQFLGSLAFAKALNRTLVLPPWVEYGSKRPSDQISFDTYFKVEPLKQYHRVMLMEEFMKDLAPSIWPVGQRKVFCYSERRGTSESNKCNAKDGNPFGPFWNHFNIDFDESVIFEPLYYDTSNPREMKRWTDRFPASKELVIAFVGPPAPFPVSRHHLTLQRYLKWSDNINDKADVFIKENIERPYVGIHIRNGVDFKSACEHVEESPTMFAAAQCVGYRSEHGKTTQEMCHPSAKTIVKEVKAAIKKIKAKTVFIATDSNDFIAEMSKAIKNVKFSTQPKPLSPHVDLALLHKSDHFIGNCLSTFTAFVKRFRDVEKTSSSFWAFKPKTKETKNNQSTKDEL